MAITKLNSLAIPPNTIVESDLSYPLTNFSSTGIDDNASSTAVTINSSQNVGIGTASPAGGATRVVDVYGSSSSAINFHNATSGTTATDGGVVGQYGNDLVLFNYEAGIIQLGTSNTERMRLDSSGNLLVGKTSTNVTVVGTELRANGLTWHTTNGIECLGLNRLTSDGKMLEFRKDGTNVGAIGTNGGSLYIETNASERMRIDNSGNLLVGATSNPATGSAGIQIFNNGGTRGRINAGKTFSGTTNSLANYHNGTYVGGVDYSNTATSFPTSSDQRLKENIVDAPAGNIDAIHIRSFDWKADGSHQTYGVIAQELVNVSPEAVIYNQEEDHWGVDYSKLVPMMIKEIQDLKAEVALLKGAN